MTEHTKRKVRGKGIKPCRDHILSFRLNESDVLDLNRALVSGPINGVKSIHHLGRKIVVDFLRGHLVYVNPNDRWQDPGQAAEGPQP
jgi:hypothetical protein